MALTRWFWILVGVLVGVTAMTACSETAGDPVDDGELGYKPCEKHEDCEPFGYCNGSGFCDHINVEGGTTVQQLFSQQIKHGQPADYLIRVNRQPVPSD